MKEIKLPLVIGILGFVLIFIINLIMGNLLSVVFLRSLIYGSFVFGVFYGIIFIFKNYFGIDYDNSEKNQSSEETSAEDEFHDERNSVDFVVGENEDLTYNESVVSDDKVFGSDTQENTLKEEERADTVGSSEAVEDFNSVDNFDEALYNDEKEDDKIDEKPQMSSEELAANIKKKIGVDVSFSDIAKAIRTKINRDQ